MQIKYITKDAHTALIAGGGTSSGTNANPAEGLLINRGAKIVVSIGASDTLQQGLIVKVYASDTAQPIASLPASAFGGLEFTDKRGNVQKFNNAAYIDFDHHNGTQYRSDVFNATGGGLTPTVTITLVQVVLD